MDHGKICHVWLVDARLLLHLVGFLRRVLHLRGHARRAVLGEDLRFVHLAFPVDRVFVAAWTASSRYYVVILAQGLLGVIIRHPIIIADVHLRQMGLTDCALLEDADAPEATRCNRLAHVQLILRREVLAVSAFKLWGHSARVHLRVVAYALLVAIAVPVRLLTQLLMAYVLTGGVRAGRFPNRRMNGSCFVVEVSPLDTLSVSLPPLLRKLGPFLEELFDSTHWLRHLCFMRGRNLIRSNYRGHDCRVLGHFLLITWLNRHFKQVVHFFPDSDLVHFVLLLNFALTSVCFEHPKQFMILSTNCFSTLIHYFLI